MKKISCPKCRRKWYEDAKIWMKVNDGYYVDAFMDNDENEIQKLIESYKLCPYCFINGDFALLQKSGIEIKSIVVQNEFGEFMDMDIKDFTKLKVSDFNPHPDNDDDDGETMATGSWGGAGPDCMPMPG